MCVGTVGTFEVGSNSVICMYQCSLSDFDNTIYKVILYGIDVHMTYLMCIRLDEGPSLLWSYGSCIYSYLWN